MSSKPVTRIGLILVLTLNNIVWLIVLAAAFNMNVIQDHVARRYAREAVSEKVEEYLEDLKGRLVPMYEEMGIDYRTDAKTVWEVLDPLLRLAEPFHENDRSPDPG